MGNPKLKWTAEEEAALRAGVQKHGTGKWKNIQRDPEFNPLLYARSNIDLKDKWRNLSVASGQGTREKSKIPKAKVSPTETPANPLPISQVPASVARPPQDAPTEIFVSETPRSQNDGNNAAKYDALIYEALSNLKEPDFSAIASFIEKKQEVPQNFRKILITRLRRLVHQGKLEKVENYYRIEREIQLPSTIEEAVAVAASNIAAVDNKTFSAAEAVQEAERIREMAEESESLLMFAEECLSLCLSGDGYVLLV